jgi:hypothetical protein
MKKIILIGLSVLAMNSQANVEKCAVMVVGMQSNDIKTAMDIDRVVRNAGLSIEEMAECAALINTPTDALRAAVMAIMPAGTIDEAEIK